jgi:ferrochelatase
MRHWHPYIHEALAAMAQAGIQRAVGLVMAPHYSRMSIGEYFKRVEQAGAPIEIARVESWNTLPGYVTAMVERIQSALLRFPQASRDSVPLVFTAHSLPQRILTWGDPYPDQLHETVRAIVARMPPRPHEFAYQSAAMTPDPWLGPDVGEVIARLAAEGRKHVLLAPIGFVCEHVEILYDVDVVYRQQAASLGMQLERTEMMNTAPGAMQGLAGRVRSAARDAGWI